MIAPEHALSLTQPWGSLVANGAKRIETRSWDTRFRGPVAIQAAKGFPGWAKEQCYYKVFLKYLRENRAGQGDVEEVINGLPRMAIVAVTEILDTSPTATDGFRGELTPGIFSMPDWTPDIDSDEYQFGDYSTGRFMWRLGEVIKLPEPIPCKGALGFWAIPEDVKRQIAEALPYGQKV